MLQELCRIFSFQPELKSSQSLFRSSSNSGRLQLCLLRPNKILDKTDLRYAAKTKMEK